MDRKQEFARKLNLLLENRGMQQIELAAKMEVSKTLISKYLHADRLPTLKQVQKLGEIFNVTTDYLLSLDGDLNPELKTIPVLGEVHAGKPSLADNNIVGYENIDDRLSIKGELFALTIKGDSMSPRFMEGDTVIVKRQSFAENGDIVVALTDEDEATIKMFNQKHDGILLEPLNPKYKALKFTFDEVTSIPVIILGVVIELRARSFR